MTNFDDPFHTPDKGTSLEQLQLYTEVLLSAAELTQTLETLPATAEDRSYIIIDPRILSLIELPSELQLFASTRTLEAIEYHATISQQGPSEIPAVSSRIELRLGEDLTAVIEAIPTTTSEFLMTVTNQSTSSVSRSLVSADEVSQLVARMTHPLSDPAFSDYRDPSAPATTSEICETLDDNESFDVSTTHEFVYELDNNFRVIFQKTDNKIRSIEITELRYDSPSITFVIEYTSLSSAGALYRSEREGSQELVVDEGDLAHFLEIIISLQGILQIAEVASTPAIDELPAIDSEDI